MNSRCAGLVCALSHLPTQTAALPRESPVARSPNKARFSRSRTNSTTSSVTYSGGLIARTGILSSSRSETPRHSGLPTWPSGSRTASALSRYLSAESLKSAVPGSSTLRKTSGRRKRSTLFDSITEFSARSSSFRSRGIASASCPCRVLTQNDRSAPAARYLPESVPSSAPARSSLIAIVWFAVSQSQGSPFAEHTPCPNCVILNAVQFICGIAEMSPATTLVLPMFRVCPPTTSIAKIYPLPALKFCARQTSPSILHLLSAKCTVLNAS